MPNNLTDSTRNGASINERARRTAPVGSADDCHAAMLRHHERLRVQKTPQEPVAPVTPEPTTPSRPGGDILYGARAIAMYIFPDDYANDPRRARRRVFNLWTYYRDRNEKAGFFKLKGALCLSRTQWRAFHGLD
jgi:hypothetical protein